MFSLFYSAVSLVQFVTSCMSVVVIYDIPQTIPFNWYINCGLSIPRNTLSFSFFEAHIKYMMSCKGFPMHYNLLYRAIWYMVYHLLCEATRGLKIKINFKFTMRIKSLLLPVLSLKILNSVFTSSSNGS